MTNPNRENIRAWVDALRSGEYVQGKFRLVSCDRDTGDKQYCCLGVASDLAVRTGVELAVEWHPVDGYGIEEACFRTVESKRGEAIYLSLPVQEWLGIHEKNPSVNARDNEEWLANLNDGGTSFAEIADLIEAEWLTGAPRGES